MKALNLFRTSIAIPERVPGYYVSFEGLSVKKRSERYAIIQWTINKLNSSNIDCATVPKNLSESYDIVLLNPAAKEIEFVKKKSEKLAPKLEKTEDVGKAVIKKAWQNRIRSHLVKKGYLKIGDQYIPKEEIETGNRFKQAFRVRAVIINGRPAIYLDPKTKIMEPLSDEVIDVADKLGDESEIMDEYYQLTHLDWASLFNQGKYELPQILTQKLGENISAGLTIPDDLVLL